MLVNMILLYPWFCMCGIVAPKDIIFGVKVTNSLIDTVTSVTLVDCMRRCKERKRCLSINYSQSSRLCEFNFHSSQSCASCMKKDPWFIFSDVTDWTLV